MQPVPRTGCRQWETLRSPLEQEPQVQETLTEAVLVQMVAQGQEEAEWAVVVRPPRLPWEAMPGSL